MKKEITFHPDVTDDIKSSYIWYEGKIKGLGDKFLEELEDGYISIQNFPDTWANFQFGFKRYILNKFPFSILYKVSNNKIFIVTIMHNSKNPNYWKERLKIEIL
jgi:toxin ParE1/3/4